MSASESAFRVLLVVSLTLAVITGATFPFQEPGTGSYVVSLISLTVQAFMILLAAAGLYFGWEPLHALDSE